MARTNRPLLIAAVLALLAAPLATQLLAHGSMPDTWGVFPPPQSPGVPGFAWPIFVLGIALAAVIVTFYVAPHRFGFRRPRAAARPVARAPLPPWTLPGAALCLASWAVACEAVPGAEALVPFAFVPQWWGFILALDGLVYRRSGGVSLVARRPATLLAVATTSCVCWFYFEYLNYFTRSNWYYPHREIFTQLGYVVWFGLAFTTVLPSVFEFYALLTTFEPLRARFADGPRFSPRREVVRELLWVGLASLALLVIWPAPLFPLIWISPLLVLTSALALAGKWTPFSPIAAGNWTPVALIGLACACNYLIGEMWNYTSTALNPNYWRYDVPYVNVLKVFEMPLLGYFGYLPFGTLCWTWWLWQARVLGLDPAIDVVPGGGPTITGRSEV